MTISKQMKIIPQQPVLCSLVEAIDVAWVHGDMLGDPSAVVKVMEVDFRRRTIVLPEGKFDLDHFLRQVRGILGYYDNTN